MIEDPGPAFVYMSKAPGSVSSYDGSGDWFKVWESGLCGGAPGNDASWCTWQKDHIEFTIPKNIPSGEWLVRAEHIAIHEGRVGKAQFYMECAQLMINGGGSGVGSPAVKIPGIAFNKWVNPQSYVMPGGPVATFGAIGNGSSTDFSNVIIQGGNATTEEPVKGDSSSDDSVALWKLCGGKGYAGPGTCAEGACISIGGFFSICLPKDH